MQSQPEKPPIPKPPPPPKRIPSLKDKTAETSEKAKKITPNQMRGMANAMMVIGFLVMTSVLLGFETTVCKTYSGMEYDCTHNIGEIGKKNNWIMYSGFLFLGGCILLNNEECRK